MSPEILVKLSELVSFSSSWLCTPHKSAMTVARNLKMSSAITVEKSGGGAADMTDLDKMTLLFAMLGCSTASKSGEGAPRWFELTRNRNFDDAIPEQFRDFEFLRHLSFHEALATLMTVDLTMTARTNHGDKLFAFDEDPELGRLVKAKGVDLKNSRIGRAWSFISESKADAENKKPAHTGYLHHVHVNLFVDEFEAEISIERDALGEYGKIERIFASYARFGRAGPAREYHGYAGETHTLNRISERSLRGWGQCLTGDGTLKTAPDDLS